MARVNAPLVTFAQGLVSPLALARVDLSRLRFAAETQTNFVPRALGPMSIRPGTRYLSNTKGDDLTKPIPFIFSNDDAYIIELGSGVLRVRDGSDDSLITRASVATSITNGNFSSGTGWTLTEATISGGVLTLTSPSEGTTAICVRSVTVDAGEINTVHAIRIIVDNGPVGFRIGTSSGGDDVLALQNLGSGEHSLTFTPGNTTIYVQYESAILRDIVVDSGIIESSGTMEIDIPWSAADMAKISCVQSGDIVFIACDGYQPRKIERRENDSWSLVLYEPEDGPFQPLPFVDCTITPSDTTGNITLTASRSIFRNNMVGSLMRLFNTNQLRESDLTTEDTYTTAIRITGISGYGTTGGPESGTRNWSYDISGTYTGVLTFQRSFDGPDSGFTDVSSLADGETGNAVLTDPYDNAIVYYRIGFKAQTPDPTGTASITVFYAGGGGSGTVRITDLTNGTVVDAEVLKELSSTTATRDWREGEWSTKYGFPTAVTLHEGRLWWLGRDRIWGSVSDAYDSFDEDLEGDAGTINRTIGYGPIDRVLWSMSLQRLLLGLSGSEASIRSGSFDTPITPTDFSIKDASTQGSAWVQPVKVDSRGVFVQRSERRVYQLAYSVDANDYAASDLTVLLPDIDSDLKVLAVQRQPDTRIYAVREDGDVMVLLFEPGEEVMAWYKIETDGDIEDICVLPGNVEDQVYWYVKRTIDGSTVRFVERVALESNCTGLPVSHLADAHVLYSGASASVRTGLDHLEGETVVCWAWDDDDDSGRVVTLTDGVESNQTVIGGQVTQLEASKNACIGLPYTAQFKSAKLAYGAMGGTALAQKKKVERLALLLLNTHASGIEFGQDFTTMDTLPQLYRGADIDDDTVHEVHDEVSVPVPGGWNSDSRLCLQASAPKPCTVLGAVITVATHEKS